MNCLNCKKGNMRETTTTYYKKIDGKYFIVEDVPCFVCDYCGEKSFNLKTLEKIETIIEGITEAKKANILTYSVAA